MFTKSDAEFDEMAADPKRRHDKIADLSKRRIIALGFVLLFMILTAAQVFSGGNGTITAIVTAITMCSYCQMESDLRLLRFIDRLQKGSDEKPAA